MGFSSNSEYFCRSSNLLFNKTESLAEKFLNEENTEDSNVTDIGPAWVDEDDSQFERSSAVNVKTKNKALNKDKLKQKYQTLLGTPGWAKLQNKDELAADDEILRTVGHLQKKKDKHSLREEVLDYKKLTKINASTRNEGATISCIEFHPSASVALVAGTSGTVSLFSIGRETNKLHNFRIAGWRNVSTADILPDGSEAYLSSSKNNKFCVYNLMRGEPKLVDLPSRINEPIEFKLSCDGKYIAVCEGFDEVFLLRTGSYELLRCLKHNTNVVSVTFSHDNKELYSFGISGEITVWDLSTYRPVKKFNDNGCVNASCINTSTCGRLLATGSKEGIVNIYNSSELAGKEPLPLKTISNLRTAITHLKFNPTTDILSLASKNYPNAVKMVHIPSYHVFKNVPDHSDDLNHVVTVNFSPNSGYMGLGNDKGLAYLYRLKHYKNY